MARRAAGNSAKYRQEAEALAIESPETMKGRAFVSKIGVISGRGLKTGPKGRFKLIIEIVGNCEHKIGVKIRLKLTIEIIGNCGR